MPTDDTVRLSAVVMTHPARVDAARALAEQLTGLGATWVVDESPPERGNLGNALRAWGAVGADATHHLVLQDDALLCEGFERQVRRAVRARPRDAISLFCEWGSRTANLVRVAAWQGWSWARVVDMYTPSQGLVLPRDAALDFVATSEGTEGADDLALVEYLRRTGRASVVTVPNLLEHDDRPSLTGNGFQGVRHSVCAARKGVDVDVDTPVAGDGLLRVPYASWMRGHAEWFYCGDRDRYSWLGDFADTRLPAGLRKADLAPRFAADLAAADPALPAAVNELTLFEYWMVYFGLGLVLPGPASPEPGPHAEAAFETAFPGLFRRYLPPAVVDRLRAAAGQLAGVAFRRGAEVDLERPYPAWYAEEAAR